MHFDAAFVPLDPRQGDHYADEILYFLKNVDCNVIFPMHYWNDASVIKRFITECPQYKSRIKNTECTKEVIMKYCNGDQRAINKPVRDLDIQYRYYYFIEASCICY